jgi:hypothetical protein
MALIYTGFPTSSWLGMLGVLPHVAEAALNHLPPSNFDDVREVACD